MSKNIPIEIAEIAIENKQLEIDMLIDKLTIKHANIQELIDRGNHLAFLILNGQQYEKEHAIKQWRKVVKASINYGKSCKN